MKANRLVLLFLLPVVILVIFLAIIVGLIYIVFGPTTIETKSNPIGTHNAKLIRHDGIDVNFKVIVDGKQVYWSPDFAPVEEDFRERVIWDKSGNIVVLEVAGERLFGYDAERQTILTNDELGKVNYVPFSHFRFEGKLPQ